MVFVSLGPGDPELITLKGLRELEAAEVIFCPVTVARSGVELSRARDIVVALGVDEHKIRLYELPMSRQRDGAMSAYAKVAREASELHKSGIKVAITAEGDGGIFSSSQYINEELIALGVETRRVAGVPAFVACGALANLHIVSGDESLEILSSVSHIDELTEPLSRGRDIVIMKLSQSEEVVKELMSGENQYNYHYFEQVGVVGREFYSSDKELIMARKFPYFSIMIIKP